jgi:hypothetical protein
MKRILFITLVAAFLLSACGAAATASPDVYYDAMPSSGGAPMEAPASVAQEGFAEDRSTSNVQAAAIERLVIQNADLSIVVADVATRMEAIVNMAEQMGGFVVSSNQYQAYANNGRTVPEGSIVIRVPAERLDEALERIKADTVDVLNESRSGQDVTAEYVDLQSRLKNLEAAEAQLARILEEAQDTEDVLNVFNQLTAIREQIEVVKGQIKYYEESASLSAISVRVVAEESIQPIEIGPWTPTGAAKEAIEDLIDFLRDFADFLIRFIIFTLPALILVFGPLYLVFLGLRAIYRRTRKPNANAQPAAATEKPKAKK